MKSANHPNKIPFEGVLTYLDRPSDKSPSGARGHCVVLTKDAAEAALDSLLGMAVGYADGWVGHNARQKCGLITQAWIEGDELKIKGYVYGRDFPEVIREMRRTDVELGMSYELADAHVQDMTAQVWTLTAVTFTGAAILLRDKAAYKTTKISLSASADEFTGELSFTGEGSVRLSAGAESGWRRLVRYLRNAR